MEYLEKLCSVKELLGSAERYFIPIYQRNYSWKEKQVDLLLQDIWDSANKYKSDTQKNYYIGNLIVLPDEGDSSLFETIDGQQRLTTLYIIMCSVLHSEELKYDMSWFNPKCLEFRNRKKSVNALEYISGSSVDNSDCEEHIVSTWSSMATKIKNMCDSDEGVRLFFDYLLDYVKVLRIPVPKGINKNHYFEVMNSRGVQLEQHEIIKAKLLGIFKEDIHSRKLFNMIWAACSNMERFVQMNISSDNRTVFFGTTWENYPSKDFDSLLSSVKLDDDNTTTKKSLIDLIEGYDNNGNRAEKDKGGKTDDEEQFYSVIDFPNFLLHVLKVFAPVDKEQNPIPVQLDDKDLSDSFTSVLNAQENQIEFVKRFAVCLIQCRYLFDKYTVRHMYSRDPDKWCMMRLKTRKNGNTLQAYYVNTFGPEDESVVDTEEVIMLVSMFHVTVPAMIRKNWLFACMKYLYFNRTISQNDYVEYLQNLAKSYMLDRYLVKEKEDKYDLVEIAGRYQGKGNVPPENHIGDDFDWSTINQGTGVEVFMFNYYDYLLWKTGDKQPFTFTHRTSVEHFYPQHPESQEIMPDRQLHSFGNLCLITSSQNSRFSNLIPSAKRSQFKDDESVIKQSLKLRKMFDSDNWWVEEVNQGEKDAIELFTTYLK